MRATLKVAYSDEPERRFKINERAIVGKSAQCTIPLPDAELMEQHFSVKPTADGVKVRLANGAPPMALDGAEFLGGVIPYDADFFVEQQRFTVSRLESLVGSGGPSPVILVAAAVAIAVCVLSFLTPEPVSGVSVSSIQIPELFTAQPCKAAEGKYAFRAREAERGARAKQERYIYDPHDGVVAGRLLTEAASCYKADGDAERSTALLADAKSWQDKVNTDITAARLRLEIALDNKDRVAALDYLRALTQLLHGEELEVVDTLMRLGRRIEHDLKGTGR